MAQENGIARADQDAYAHRSHVRAAAAWADGRFAGDVAPVGSVTEDNCVRKRATLEEYAALRPVFDRKTGTITPGNSSPLTDGASAGLFMREDRAKSVGLAPLAYVKAIAFTALDPRGQLLMGPAYAIPKALARAGVTWRDLALVDLHEAFAAQVLSVTQAIESKAWAAQHLGRRRAPRRAWSSRRSGDSRRRAAPRARRGDRHDRLGPLQRHGRIDRARPPVRGDRHAADHAARPRAGPARRRAGAGGGLRGRRAGRRDRSGSGNVSGVLSRAA
jgi:hypothetical protein